MDDINQITAGGRRRAYQPATHEDIQRYEAYSTLHGNEPMQLDGSVQFQVLHAPETDAQGRTDFLDVHPIGSSPTDVGAIALVQEHHASSGECRDLWFLRGAGRNGEEIHAGHGSGLHSNTRYRIVMVRTRNER